MIAVPEVERLFTQIPFGLPTEATPGPSGPKKKRGFVFLRNYGLDSLDESLRPPATLGFRNLRKADTGAPGKRCSREDYPYRVSPRLSSPLPSLPIDRLADYSKHRFVVGIIQGKRFAIQFWSLCFSRSSGILPRFPDLPDFQGGYLGWQSNGSACFIGHSLVFLVRTPHPGLFAQKAVFRAIYQKLDVILTDPPYYDSIPYSDLMDFLPRLASAGLPLGLSPAYRRSVP